MIPDPTEIPPLEVPARSIPWPSTISQEARAMAHFLYTLPNAPLPAGTDLEAWAALLAAGTPRTPETIVGMAMGTVGGVAGSEPVAVSERTAGEATVFTAPSARVADDDRVLLAFHGGGWTDGGGEVCRAAAWLVASTYGVPAWAVDWRMPPSHPYPAGLDDAVAAYRALLEERAPERIAVFGMSAGGNLAAALMLRIADEGLPAPAALVLSSPAVDLTGSGDTAETNRFGDTVPSGRLTERAILYAGGHDLLDPYLSPIQGDATAFPPTVLIAGTRDVLLSDTVRMHRALRAAGTRADLHVFEGAPHGLFAGQAPEDREAAREVTAFLDELIPPIGA